jgi:hypothetical protein
MLPRNMAIEAPPGLRVRRGALPSQRCAYLSPIDVIIVPLDVRIPWTELCRKSKLSRCNRPTALSPY